MNKISYKTYLNDRLKQVDFHGQLTYPLYVQVTFERKTIFFKSYYFELFSKSRYGLELPDGSVKGPDMEQIIEKENEVIRFVIGKMKDGFSLEAFKKNYAYLSKDLCDVTEFDFITFLYLFFDNKEMPHMAELIKWGALQLVTYDLIMDFKKVLKKALYNELIEQAFEKAPPYLQLYSFMMDTKKWPMLCLTAMEWDNMETIKSFKKYVELHYPKLKSTTLIGQVSAWPNYRRKVF
ncbi:hypothetical protein SAMN05216464_111153 [Mucilaginibacter pineti]|uniref:Uncharacterized protein n=1 Tax=Mucilaginibacter pineti TaxID=1391627 RepID=A0A1G7HBK8_9SPHI|nr:hypothetical protein [Mucilaginibacter pineti]SDE97778.1 hypothetical protein SAMN05216464_111153 [Mucilaginibacter pineti]